MSTTFDTLAAARAAVVAQAEGQVIVDSAFNLDAERAADFYEAVIEAAAEDVFRNGADVQAAIESAVQFFEAGLNADARIAAEQAEYVAALQPTYTVRPLGSTSWAAGITDIKAAFEAKRAAEAAGLRNVAVIDDMTGEIVEHIYG